MTISTLPRIAAIAIISMSAALFLPVSASGDSTGDDDDDDVLEHYEAQQALKRGEIRPLEEIIEAVRKEISGDIIELEFE